MIFIYLSIFLWKRRQQHRTDDNYVVIYWNFLFLKEDATIYIAATKLNFPASSRDFCTYGWFSNAREDSTVMENLLSRCTLLSALLHVCFFTVSIVGLFPAVQQLWLVLFGVNIYVMEVSKSLNQPWSFITCMAYICRKENSFSWRNSA